MNAMQFAKGMSIGMGVGMAVGTAAGWMMHPQKKRTKTSWRTRCARSAT